MTSAERLKNMAANWAADANKWARRAALLSPETPHHADAMAMEQQAREAAAALLEGAEALERGAEAGKLVDLATEYQLGPIPGVPEHWTNVVKLCRCEGFRLPKQPYMWSVRWGPDVLNKDGEWEYEPLPSSRTDAFYARCRFDTREDAFTAATAAIDAALKEGEDAEN